MFIKNLGLLKYFNSQEKNFLSKRVGGVLIS